METSTINGQPADNVYGPLHGAVNQTTVQLHGAVDDAVDATLGKVQPAIERVQQAAHDTVNKVSDAAAPTAAWLDRQSERIQAVPRDALADARAYVVANPWQSLGAALAAGFLVGRLTR